MRRAGQSEITCLNDAFFYSFSFSFLKIIKINVTNRISWVPNQMDSFVYYY